MWSSGFPLTPPLRARSVPPVGLLGAPRITPRLALHGSGGAAPCASERPPRVWGVVTRRPLHLRACACDFSKGVTPRGERRPRCRWTGGDADSPPTVPSASTVRTRVSRPDESDASAPTAPPPQGRASEDTVVPQGVGLRRPGWLYSKRWRRPAPLHRAERPCARESDMSESETEGPADGGAEGTPGVQDGGADGGADGPLTAAPTVRGVPTVALTAVPRDPPTAAPRARRASRTAAPMVAPTVVPALPDVPPVR